MCKPISYIHTHSDMLDNLSSPKHDNSTLIFFLCLLCDLSKVWIMPCEVKMDWCSHSVCVMVMVSKGSEIAIALIFFSGFFFEHAKCTNHERELYSIFLHGWFGIAALTFGFGSANLNHTLIMMCNQVILLLELWEMGFL